MTKVCPTQSHGSFSERGRQVRGREANVMREAESGREAGRCHAAVLENGAVGVFGVKERRRAGGA